jgi:hypothetical protein
MAADLEALRENISAATATARQSALDEITLNEKTFVLDSAVVEYGKKYELKYKETNAPQQEEVGAVLYIRFLPNMDKLEGYWMTDENVAEYVYSDANAPTPEEVQKGEEQKIILAELGNKSSAATKKVIYKDDVLNGVLEMQYSDGRITREVPSDEKPELLAKLIAFVAKAEFAHPREIIAKTLAQVDKQEHDILH